MLKFYSHMKFRIRLYNMLVTDEKLSRNKITKIARDIADSHQEYNPFPLTKTLKIAKEDIMTGVICPQCKRIGMLWYLKKWHCPGCSYNSANCHLALSRRLVLFNRYHITNRQFRSFSGIEHQPVAKRLLKKSGLVMKGNRRTAFYIR